MGQYQMMCARQTKMYKVHVESVWQGLTAEDHICGFELPHSAFTFGVMTQLYPISYDD